ncbi:3-hydroxyacyl-ACP dehydratase FabZ [Anaerococcus sp. AGMB00486]|uniref:3-hydroxyacyl-ACP dehydratase FabZ n=3 Tax=Anaerococcus TaxID=165779 RepID=A0ABX2N9T3_9FIRM|nr:MULTISPECIES: 3-hydroxyacyl-ACP dehydratase FabZ [Anaerococcus]MSS78324.1 3-hydroxyacyl-ACP dehydratase FabZ [Anaerococcus porci]NVF11438.1 3-hydroxyacyl-ACP dehydratase FabZ [Anaerococcus faecalis]
MEINFDQLKEILPHSYPFIMIDKIVEIDNNKYAKGIKSVSGGEYYFQGHFQQEAIMPGVLQIEAVAQVGAVALLRENPKRLALLGGIKNARFYKPVKPGDYLEITCEMMKIVKNLGIGKGNIIRDGEIVMTCEISFALK